MTILFSDTFDGSGSIVGHTPNVPFGGQVWSVDSGAGVDLVSGQAVGVGAYGTYIRYGAASTSYGLPGDFTLNFDVTTSASMLSTANGETAFQIILGSAAGDNASFSMYKDYGVWNLVFDTSGASNTISPANSTTYSGTIVLSGGVATCTFMGTTVSATVLGGAFASLSNIRIYLVSTVALNGVTTSVVSPESANISVTAPSATCVSWSAAHATYALTGPVAMVSAHALVMTYAATGITAPTPTLRSTAHDATGENDFTYTTASPLLTITTGANSALTGPSPTLDTSGTVTILAATSVKSPSATLSSVGTTTTMANTALTFGYANGGTYSLVGFSGALCSVTLTSAPTVAASGTTGGVSSVELELPLFSLSASGRGWGKATAALLAPSMKLGAQAQAWLVAPGAKLTCIGHAGVAVVVPPDMAALSAAVSTTGAARTAAVAARDSAQSALTAAVSARDACATTSAAADAALTDAQASATSSASAVLSRQAELETAQAQYLVTVTAADLAAGLAVEAATDMVANPDPKKAEELEAKATAAAKKSDIARQAQLAARDVLEAARTAYNKAVDFDIDCQKKFAMATTAAALAAAALASAAAALAAATSDDAFRVALIAEADYQAAVDALQAAGAASTGTLGEAYAVNLKHNPVRGVDPIDEATRYTNFPFTHVVRYQNSYYGANSTGLYLLEGTTDDGTPTPFAVKTAMTDFKSPTKKTLASAYFSGRFGPASTVQLHAGEQAPNTYSYSTPRDALAQNHRQVFGRGLKERYFALGLSGTGTLELDGVELDVHNTTRRI